MKKRIRCAAGHLTSSAFCASLAILAACSDGGQGNDPGDGLPVASCTENLRKQFVLDTTRDWYLFQDLLPATANPEDYETAEELLDHLTATAREQGKDRHFTYLTTREEDDALFGDGRYYGFGFRSRLLPDDRSFIVEVFENSPAAANGLRRGDEILAIDAGDGYFPVTDLLDQNTSLSDLFGPAEPGVQRGLRLLRDGLPLEVSLTKDLVTIDPVDNLGGVTVLPLQGTNGVGYLNLRSYVSAAEPQIIEAFENFRGRGIDYFIVDLRYNGGGLIYIAEIMNNLLGGARRRTDVQYRIAHNPMRSSEDSSVFFRPLDASAWPVRIAFLTTGATASASELNINSMRAWVEVAIVGENTFGKPVGQYAFDLSGCEDRLRLVSFKSENAAGDTDYFDGLAGELRFACDAEDTLDRPPGDPLEGMTAAALHWISTGACARPMGVAAPAQAKSRIGLPSDFARSRQPPRPVDLWNPGAT